MNYIRIMMGVLIFFSMAGFVLGQETDNLQAAVYSKIHKMTKELKLTDAQANAIEPVIKDYLVKKRQMLQENTGSGLLDHGPIIKGLQILKDTEHKQLAKILTPDQMEKWLNKENFMSALNPDASAGSEDDDVSLTAEGANFKF